MEIEQFTQRARKAIQAGGQAANAKNHSEFKPLHLLHSLLKDKDGVPASLLNKSNYDVGKIRDDIQGLLSSYPTVSGQEEVRPSRLLQNILQKAVKEADQKNDEYASTEHLLLALLAVKNTDAHDVLKDHNIKKEDIENAMDDIRGSQSASDPNAEAKYEVLEKFGRDLIEEAEEGNLDPVIGREEEIRRITQILSRRTKNNPILIGEPGVGKTAIVEGLARRIVEGEVTKALENKRIIELDVGSMVAGAKYRGEFEDRLKAFIDEVKQSDGEIILFIDEVHQVVGAGDAEGSVDAANMLKPPLARGELRAIGATTLDEFRENIEQDPALERRFQQMKIDESSIDDTVSILRGLQDRYEAHHGVRIQDSALVAAAKMSDRYIGDRFLPDKAIDLIDEAASGLRIEMDSKPKEIDRVERDIMQLEMEQQALENEDSEEAQERLNEVKKELADLREKQDQLKAKWKDEKEIVDRVAELQEELEELKIEQEQAQRDGNLDRASELEYGEIPDVKEELEEQKERIDELQDGERMLKEEVTDEDVARVVSNWTGIPVTKLLESEREKLVNMEERLRSRVVAQDEAVEAVSDAIRRSRSGLQDPNQPIGSFIFMGPTGVGKTELAKSLAEFMFDDEDKLIRVDMSEFMEKHSVSRFMGAPPGYVGYEEGGYLTEQVRRNPYSVILFDEVEKAHRDVLNAMLQILDDGHMTDGQGRTVDFRNTVIIMTSNVGSDDIQETFEANPELDENSAKYKALKDRVMDKMRSNFRPEFLNRVDDTIIFHALSKQNLKKIVDIQINRLTDRFAEQGIDLVLTDDARTQLAEEGYDPVYGARPLQRVIQNRIVDTLAMKVLEGEIPDDSTVTVNVQDEQFTFTVQ